MITADENLGYGFNAQWAYSRGHMPAALPADTRMLDFMAKYDFKFLRLPTDYRFWIDDLEGPIHESFLKLIDSYVHESVSRGIYIEPLAIASMVGNRSQRICGLMNNRRLPSIDYGKRWHNDIKASTWIY